MQDLINIADFEKAAAERLEPGVLGYFAGAACDEVTLGDNLAAWRRWRLRPRMLAGVGEVDTSLSCGWGAGDAGAGGAGRRERDLRTGFKIPEGIGVPNSVQAALDSQRAAPPR